MAMSSAGMLVVGGMTGEPPVMVWYSRLASLLPGIIAAPLLPSRPSHNWRIRSAGIGHQGLCAAPCHSLPDLLGAHLATGTQ